MYICVCLWMHVLKENLYTVVLVDKNLKLHWIEGELGFPLRKGK